MKNSDQLEGNMPASSIMNFLIKTPDGILVCLLSIAYLVFGVMEAAGVWPIKSQPSWYVWAGHLMMPILLMLVFIRLRAGTKIKDKKPILFSVISILAIALAPVYSNFYLG